MTHPIPITFSRDLPDQPGCYLLRGKPGFPITVALVEQTYQGRLHVGRSFVEEIGGEWAGPLQLIEQEIEQPTTGARKDGSE